MGHFSKFIQRDSVRIATTVDRKTSLEYTAFLTPNKDRILVILNRQAKSFLVEISEESVGSFIVEIPARSIQTFKWIP